MKQIKEARTEVKMESITPAQRVRNDLNALWAKLSYRRMLGAVPYMSFLALLAVVYIGNNHRAVEMQRELNKQQKTLKELRWRDMDTKTRLMNAGMETKMIQNTEPLGLKPLTLPAYSITLSE